MPDSFCLELGRRGPGFPGPQAQLGAKLREWVLLRERGQQTKPSVDHSGQSGCLSRLIAGWK